MVKVAKLKNLLRSRNGARTFQSTFQSAAGWNVLAASRNSQFCNFFTLLRTGKSTGKSALRSVDKRAECGINDNSSEQPKLAFLPEGQRGGPKFLESHIRGRGERSRVTAAKVTSRTEPDS